MTRLSGQILGASPLSRLVCMASLPASTMHLPTLAAALLLALLSGAPSARAQEAHKDIQEDKQAQRFMRSVAHAVVHLEADDDRTMDAIENSHITLTLDTVQDGSRLAVLCNNGGKDLNVFTQSLAGELQLNGKVYEAACSGPFA